MTEQARADERNVNVSAVLRAAVAPSLKESFKEWWVQHHFASEAEAIRYLARYCIEGRFTCQAKIA